MAPPAKRRKRNVVEDSEAEDGGSSPQATRSRTIKHFFSSPAKPADSDDGARAESPSPVRKQPGRTPVQPQVSALSASPIANRTRATKLPAKSPSTSPEKSKSKAQKKGKPEEKGKTADLLALFSKQAERSQANGDAKANGYGGSASLSFDDIVSDPISEDDDVGINKAVASSFVGKNAQKRLKDSSQSGPSSSAASGRFLRPPRLASAGTGDEDHRPWSERFAPVNLDELAVHKKKVADVRKWLEDVIAGRMRQRLLVLKGAAGTGKTTTMQLLAKELGVDILEWRNPVGQGVTQGFQSISAQFEEFLGRGNNFGQLDFEDDTTPPPPSKTELLSDSGRRLMLVEEFPNTFMRSSSALSSFRKTILGYLAANTPSLASFAARQAGEDSIIPVVMIISETLLTTSSASADSFTAHRLLGPDILRHPGTAVIEFNAIAPSLLAKALELVVQKEARKSGRRRTPGPLVLKRLGEIGDIRSAISSLEFLCLKGDDDADWGSRVAFTKPKRGSKEAPALTEGERESLEMVSQREASLGIFHAVGKVVYNKRDEAPFPPGSVEAEAETLPEFISQHSRPKRSQVGLDTLIEETGTDTQTFISALHENYVLSCERSNPADPNSSVDYINGCIEALSESDLICPSWDIFFGGRGFGGGYWGRDAGSHILRQDEIAFEVAVRGLLFSLPSPVKRHAPHGGRGADAFKIFYPTSIKLWRVKEELEDFIDSLSTKMLNGEVGGLTQHQPASSALSAGASAFRRKPGSSVGDWASAQKSLNYSSTQVAKMAEQPAKEKEDDPPPLISLGNAARKELILERLPYMAHIARRRQCSFGSMGVRDLEKIVSFKGIGVSQSDEPDDEADDDGAPAADAWATDKPTDDSSPRKKSRGSVASLSRTKSQASSLTEPLRVDKLVLSDDDIEDD